MIDTREICLCGHGRDEHDHYVAECYCCEGCAMFTDRNDLDVATPPVCGTDGAVPQEEGE